jgi:hypothetical protein
MKEGGPWFILVAGINGAGKSTFAQNHGTLFTGERGEDTMCRLQRSNGAGHGPWRICPGSGSTHRLGISPTALATTPPKTLIPQARLAATRPISAIPDKKKAL